MLVTYHEKGQLSLHLIGLNGSHAKTGNERFTTVGSRCRQVLKFEKFAFSFGRLRERNNHAACVTRLFVLFRPILLLYFGVPIAAAIVFTQLEFVFCLFCSLFVC